VISQHLAALLEEAYGTLPHAEMVAQHKAINALLARHGSINVWRSDIHHAVHIGGTHPPSAHWTLVHTESR
jgi:hypothetical protein